jgi:hypothetical protein
MTYNSGFEPYVTRERNEGIRREVQTLRLEKRLRHKRRSALRYTAGRPGLEGHVCAAARGKAREVTPSPRGQ